MRSIYVVALILLLSSCIHVSKKQDITKISQYNKALEKQYKFFADETFKEGPWLDGLYYNNKSKNSALGKDVLPESILKLKIAQDQLPNLLWASDRLANFSLDSVKVDYPDRLAKAQVFFDCWARRTAKKMRPEKIEECRMDFVLELSSLENVLMPVSKASSEEKFKGVVYFSLNNTETNAEGIQIIDSAINAIKEKLKYQIKLSGYTGDSVDNNHNKHITQHRMKTITKHFTDRGIDKNSIIEIAYNKIAPPKKNRNYKKNCRCIEIEAESTN